MTPFSFKITSDHMLLCVFLSLLLGVTNSNTTSTPDTMSTSDRTESLTTQLTTQMTTLSTPKPPLANAKEFKSIGQNETSITLQWEKVDDILNYRLLFSRNETNVTASLEEEQVTYSVLGLTSGTKYSFSLFTLLDNAISSGVNITAATAPKGVKHVEVLTQNESSITLRWNRANNISTYLLQYDNKGSFKEENITVPHQEASVRHEVSPLTAGTKYTFTLIAVFEGVNSTGFTFEGVTVPCNTEKFEIVTQNETSITLQWKKVDNITKYQLLFNGNEINVTASLEEEQVTYSVLGLTSGTKYSFSLFTLLDNVISSGVNITAATAPKGVKHVEVLTQNESSITLRWNRANNISTYLLQYDNKGSFKEENITVPHQEASVRHEVSPLTAGTKYTFTLIAVFEGVNSTGFTFEGVTVPCNTEKFEIVTQNETSITLQWKKVDNITKYQLLFNGNEINVNASLGEENVTYTASGLTNGTKYNFSLFTLFENITSSGVNITAATAPRNPDEFGKVTQNETSITLQWKKVGNITKYQLLFNGNEINVNASLGEENVTYTASGLTNGTKYNFSLFTLFENITSRGVNITAATAPRNPDEFGKVTQNETSITLQWNKVDNITNYRLLFSGNEINVTALLEKDQVTFPVLGLTNGTKYNFSLFTLFENITSSGVNITAATAPRNPDEFGKVTQNETSITLQWKKVDNITKYQLLFNGNEINVNASLGEENVTYTASGLTNGTKYNFSLFTLFENITSSGVNITAATAPRNTDEFGKVTQNETSITLQWKKVDNITKYQLLFNGNEINVNASGHENVTYTAPGLTSGTKYNFSLVALFENIKSSGVHITAATEPSMVTSVNVTERSVNSITLAWSVDVDKDWSYFLEINRENLQLHPKSSRNVLSHTVSSLQPGTEYPFSVITMFFGLNSIAYENFTVTTINCSNESWHVTTSSIQGTIEGLFTNATATNTSQTHVSPGGNNVSFTGLYPGATYEVLLTYEKNSKEFEQCRHNLTIIPPVLNAHCEYWGGGYSVLIVWNKPDGVYTEVEVNVNGETSTVNYMEQHTKISGFLPARTYEVTVTSLSGTVRNYTPFVFSCPTDPRGVIAGSVFAVLLFVALVCLAVFILLKRPDIISRKKPFIVGSKVTNNKCKAISVAKFPDHFYQLSADENRGFSQEYETFFPVGTEQTRREALLPENKARNRFNNVLPYDWCRVKLSTANNSANSDYINASYMPGYKSNREYIATQGPLPSTVNDFWRMIWEQRVKVIVMVTNCTEGGRAKCEQYWPADQKPCLYGELLITMRSEQQQPKWTLREFRMKNSNTAEECTVRHFHFTAWPDHGVPQGTEVLIQFRGLVRQHIQREGAGAPTVVHCSAGVGRTGTIIALDVLLQQLEKENAVGINTFVHKMRLNRPHMVQTESQYVFLHQCIMDCLQPQENTEENIYENADMIYANATALRELHSHA